MKPLNPNLKKKIFLSLNRIMGIYSNVYIIVLYSLNYYEEYYAGYQSFCTLYAYSKNICSHFDTFY